MSFLAQRGCQALQTWSEKDGEILERGAGVIAAHRPAGLATRAFVDSSG
jgi:hypothetical protein